MFRFVSAVASVLAIGLQLAPMNHAPHAARLSFSASEAETTVSVGRASGEPDERNLKDPELIAFRDHLAPLLAANSSIEEIRDALALEYSEVELSELAMNYLWEYVPGVGWVRTCEGEQMLLVSDSDITAPFTVRFRTVMPL